MTNERTGADSGVPMSRLAETLIPELARRLADPGLGELEIERHGVRVRGRAAADARKLQPSTSAPDAAAALAALAPDQAAAPPARGPAPVLSPAVGIFVYGQGLGPGMNVSTGDQLGHVEMLGVQYEVRSPETGRVSHLVAETGEAVEYGQVLIQLDPEPVG